MLSEMLYLHFLQGFLAVGAEVRTDACLFKDSFRVLGLDGIVVYHKDKENIGIQPSELSITPVGLAES